MRFVARIMHISFWTPRNTRVTAQDVFTYVSKWGCVRIVDAERVTQLRIDFGVGQY